MAYTKQNAVQMMFAIGVIIAIAAVFYSVSGRYDSEVGQGFEAPSIPLVVSSEKPLLIPLPHGKKAIAGVVVYPANESTATSMVSATIQDDTGTILAKKQWQDTRYKQNESSEMRLLFNGKTYTKKQKLFLSLKPLQDTSLEFIAKEGNAESPEPALVFSILYQEPVSSATKQGVYIGTILAICLVLFYYFRGSSKQKWFAAGAIISLFSLLATLPYIYRPSDLGINDWDYRYSLSHVYQATIRDYHQVPLWNPYVCGGSAVVGDPELALFTPSFLAQLLFGVENGTGLSLSCCFIITGLGMLLLARSLRLDPFPALISALIVMFSSALMLKATEGHVTIIFAYMWIPWALWAWVQAYKGNPLRHDTWTFLCGFFLALAFLEGGVYVLSYTALSFLGLSLLCSRRLHALKISFFAGIWLIGLGAFQLIPSLLWVKEFPDPVFVGSAYTYTHLWDIFFGRYVQNAYVLPNQLSHWHEYGAYIGYGVFTLVLVGLSYVRSSRIVRILCIGMIATLIFSCLGPLFQPILEHLRFLPRSNISRLVLFTLLCGSLIAGFGMKRMIALLSPRYAIIPVLIASFIGIDLLSVGYPIATSGFDVPRPIESIPHAPFPIAHNSEAYYIRQEGHDIPRTYPAVVQGYGTSFLCAAIGPRSAVITMVPNTQPPSYISSEKNVQTTLISWSPNNVVFSYDAPYATTITLNSNYAQGWQTNRGIIRNKNGIIAVYLPAGKDTVAIHYSPAGLYFGIFLSAITLIGIVLERKRFFYLR